PTWTWIATVVLFIIIIWLSSVPRVLTGEEEEAAMPVAPAFARFVEDVHFDAARDVVLSRCSMCHAQEPVWEGIVVAPNGVLLETDAEIAAQAREIYLQAGRSHAMPPANITFIEPAERRLLVAWFESAVAAKSRPDQ
ncbi:MAG: cysteine desulfurase, partial [Pseudomonadota bacterium]